MQRCNSESHFYCFDAVFRFKEDKSLVGTWKRCLLRGCFPICDDFFDVWMRTLKKKSHPDEESHYWLTTCHFWSHFQATMHQIKSHVCTTKCWDYFEVSSWSSLWEKCVRQCRVRTYCKASITWDGNIINQNDSQSTQGPKQELWQALFGLLSPPVQTEP